MIQDYINGLFEFCGSFFIWMNVKRLYRDKEVKGAYWPAWAFFAVWGIWNLFYYPSLNQWASFLGGVLVVVGNIAWVALFLWYKSHAG